MPFFESDLEIFERVAPLFNQESPQHTIKLGEHYGWDEVEPLFVYLAQALYGDVTQYQPTRPPFTEPLEQLQWDYWSKAAGVSKKEAREKFLAAALPIMDRGGFSWENPNKALVDKNYEDCISSKLAEGKSLEEIKKAREAFLQQ